ncbi:UNVERIFIED_CONTAM: hypothetical protein FKN15_075620 [Acipenser sinensis]
MRPIAWRSPVRVQAIPLPAMDGISQGAERCPEWGGLRSARVSSAHHAPASPVDWPESVRGLQR